MIETNASNAQECLVVPSTGKGKITNFLKNLILFGVTFGIMLVMGEGLVRWVFGDITTTGDNTSYFAQRWKNNPAHISLNSLGFRNSEFNTTKPEGVYRIAIVGDSFTFGHGIDKEARFGNQLEKDLNNSEESTLDYEVLNFGRGGAETEDHLVFLHDHVLSVNPDYVLLQWFINDFEGHNKKGRPHARPLAGWGAFHRYLHQSSALYYLLNRQFTSFQSAVGYVDPYSDYMFRRFGDPNSPGSVEFRRLLSEFIDTCRRRHIPVGLVLFPDIGEIASGKTYSYVYLHEQVLNVCKQKGVFCLDLREVFEPYKSHSLKVNRFDGHPNSFANRLAATRIFESMKSLWMGGESLR